MAGGVGAAVVLREQLDVLVVLAPVNLVLDAVVREVNLAVEVRQVVLARPLADLVFVSVRTSEHNDVWMKKFSAAVEEFPEVVEFYRMSGEVDYLMRVVVPDIGAYDAFYKRLIGKINLTDVSSAFAMGQIKYTTALPLDFAIITDDDK